MPKRTIIPRDPISTTPRDEFLAMITPERTWPNEDAEMQPQASRLGVPLSEREACNHCGHLHRNTLAMKPAKCECSRLDGKTKESDDE